MSRNKTIFLTYIFHIFSLVVVTWLKDNHPLTTVDNILLSNQGQVLQITNAQIHNAGAYKCVASSLVGTAEMTYVLQVHGNVSTN